jgi:RecG-like helicase
LVSLREAFEGLHFPKTEEDILRGKKRIIYEQFLKFYLSLNLSSSFGKRRSVPLRRTGELTEKFVESLPFRLTEEQLKVMGEIEEDMGKEEAMHRLLQGDVGSGKTVVLLWSALIAIEKRISGGINGTNGNFGRANIFRSKKFSWKPRGYSFNN